jgi:hypothetical protein
MNNYSAKKLPAISCTHPPGPLLLQAKEGGVKHLAKVLNGAKKINHSHQVKVLYTLRL